jgi:CRP-like cAMP-binding protein
MNQDKLRKHKDEAARQLAKGRLKEALDELLAVQKLEPGDLANRQKVGDIYSKLGNKPEAIKAYQAVAGAYAADGLLLKSIAVCKIILQLDANHSETQRTLADLYGKKRGDSPTNAELPAAMSAAISKPPVPGQKMSASMIRGAPAGSIALDNGRTPTALPIPVARVAMTQVAAPRVPTGVPPPMPPQDSFEIDLSQSDEMVLEVQPTPARPAAPAVVVGQALPANGPPRVTPHGWQDEDIPLVAGTAAPGHPAAVVGTPLGNAPAASWGAVPATPAPIDLGYGSAPRAAAAAPAGPAMLEDFEMPAPPPTSPDLMVGEEKFHDLEESSANVDLTKLPPIPLFSDLSKNAFIELMERMDIRNMTTGDVIVREGEVGNSFFIIASGQVHVEKTVNGTAIHLATLNDGTFFGEIALLSDAPRTASVVADTDGELFEISRSVLDKVIAEYPSVHQVMMRFYKQRLLSNLLNTSPIFSRFDKTQRKALIEMFRSREVAPGEAVLTEGQKGDGLYVVLSGRCSVVKGGRPIPGVQLKEGDVFGEMSLLTREPVSATIQANGRVIVLRLPRKQFNEVIMTHPQVLEMISEISAARQRAPGT